MSEHQYGKDSSVGEDLYNQASGSGGGISREVPRERPVIGYRRPVRDPRLVPYDWVDARRGERVEWTVGKLDRLSPSEAGDKMCSLYEKYGLRGAAPAVMEAFHEALYYAYTVNSGSTIQPAARTNITLGGNAMPYHWATEYLANDLRRWGRAYADEIRDNNLRILEEGKYTMDRDKQEKAEMIRQVAAERGLQRHPELAHDSSDACWGLSDGERAALAVSRGMVFSNSVNMADRVRYRPGTTMDANAGNIYGGPTARSDGLAAR